MTVPGAVRAGAGRPGGGWSRLGRKLAVAAPITALVLGLAACGDSAIDGDTAATNAVVGSADATQSRVVAEIYAAALRGTGKIVSTDLAVGDRADAIRALESGRVSLVPEHSGALIEYFQPDAPAVLGEPADTLDQDAAEAETYRQLSSVLPEYLRVADPALARQQPAMAMARKTADALQVSSVGDLGPECGALTLGVEPGMLSQATVLRSLAEVEQCEFADVVQVRSPADARAKLEADEIQVVGTFAGAPGLDGDGVTALDFPQGLLPAENVIPLFRRGSLNDDEIRALNKVAGELITEDLQEMVRLIDVDGRQFDTVVAEWLGAHGF